MADRAGWMIYGANGFTGQLVAVEAKRQGLCPVLAGRRAGPIEALAEDLGMPAREIAETLGVPVGTVQSRLLYATSLEPDQVWFLDQNLRGLLNQHDPIVRIDGRSQRV